LKHGVCKRNHRPPGINGDPPDSGGVVGKRNAEITGGFTGVTQSLSENKKKGRGEESGILRGGKSIDLSGGGPTTEGRGDGLHHT